MGRGRAPSALGARVASVGSAQPPPSGPRAARRIPAPAGASGRSRENVPPRADRRLGRPLETRRRLETHAPRRFRVCSREGCILVKVSLSRRVADSGSPARTYFGLGYDTACMHLRICMPRVPGFFPRFAPARDVRAATRSADAAGSENEADLLLPHALDE